jgi:hypothetical protein
MSVFGLIKNAQWVDDRDRVPADSRERKGLALLGCYGRLFLSSGARETASNVKAVVSERRRRLSAI